jgi:hypothetical protein
MTDRHTKIVLTVIAVMLTIIAARDLSASAVAQAPMHVMIDGVAPSAAWGGNYIPLPVRIEK